MMRLVRGNNAEGREVMAYITARRNTLLNQLAAPLLPERESDQIRGRLAELQKLNDAVNNDGDANE